MKETMKMVTNQFGVGTDLVFEQETPSPEPVAQPDPEPHDNGVSESPEQEPIAQASAPEIPEPPVKQTRNANNFRALKAQTEKIARERDEAKALIAQYEQKLAASQNYQSPKQSEPDDFDIDADAYAEGKHIKAMASQVKAMKQQLQQTQLESQRIAVKNVLREEHPDFDKVVNRQTLESLELTYPHLARAINVNDPYTAGKACYDLIKQFGIHQEDEVETTQLTKAIIDQNLAKPKTAAAVKGTRPTNESTIGRASEFYQGELSDAHKKQFYKEMQDAMKGFGGYKP